MALRCTLLVGVLTACLVARSAIAADTKVSAGLGESVGFFTVIACSPGMGALTLLSKEWHGYGGTAYTVRIQRGDSVWGDIPAGWNGPVSGTITLDGIKACVGSFVLREAKQR